MKYCKYCGSQIDDAVIFCPTCGANQNASESARENTVNAAVVNPNEKHTGYVVLGFFFPIVALILYFLWKDNEPAKALACGKGGLMSLSFSPIIGLVMYLVMKDKYPDIAKACGICAILGVVFYVFFYIAYFAFIFLVGFSGALAGAPLAFI